MNLNKIFGTKKADGEVSTTSKESDTAPGTTDENVTDVSGTDETLSTAGDPAAPAPAAATGEPADKNSDAYADWTKDQIIKEMKASREEAAKNRVEKKEVERQLREEYDKQLKSLEEKFSPYVEKAQELKKLQEKELDRKRSLEEKLAVRENKIEELLSEKTSLENTLKSEKVELQSQLEKKVAELNAYETYWKEQLDKELAEVPQKHRKLADMIVKGAGTDVREALEAIRQAKNENVFGTKKVTVYNATPGAKDGARLDAASAQKTKNENMSKKDKISSGLAKWKSLQRRRMGSE